MTEQIRPLPAEQAEPRETATEMSYRLIQDMVISFAIRPGERVNESELSRRLGVSRTPLREALNRLASENFLDFVPAKGFFRKEVRPKEIYDLLELRIALESAGARLAVQNASDEDIARMRTMAYELSNIADLAPSAIVPKDEAFHETLTGLSGNGEILQTLRAVNTRIRPLRYLGIQPDRIVAANREHEEAYEALVARDADRLVALLVDNIWRPRDEIERAVRELYGEIYVRSRADGSYWKKPGT